MPSRNVPRGGRGPRQPQRLALRPSPALGFNLVGSAALSNGLVILNYEFDKMLA